MTAHIFIDTNIALHFKRPEYIDWCKIVECDHVYLVATQTLLHEIDEKAYSASSRRLRRRADSFARNLDKYIDGPHIQVRHGVYWRFLHYTPYINFREYQLSENVNDDHIIAAVLCYTDYEPSDSLYVATNDRPLKVKLKYNNISILELPEEYRAADEPDPVEQERDQLKKNLARERDRAPALTLQAHSGASFFEVAPEAPNLSNIPDLTEIKQTHGKLHRQGEPSQTQNSLEAAERITQRMGLLGVPDYQIDHYNKKLDKFYERYAQYLEKIREWQERIAGFVPVELKLVNDGRGPANNIHITLWFPKDVVLYSANDVPQRPEAPKPPDKPSIANIGLASLSPPMVPRMMDYPVGPPRLDGVPKIDLFDSDVTIHVSALSHTFEKAIDLFYVSLEGMQEWRSFSFDYEIVADETPDPINGCLHVKLKKE